MKKIVACISDLSKGGAQGVFVNVVNFLCENGYDVEVVVQNLNDPVHKEKLDPRINIVDLKVQSAKKMLPKLIQYVLRTEFSVAIAFYPEIAVNLYLIKKILKKKYKIVGRCINTLSVEFEHTSAFFRKHITCNLLKLFYNKIDFAICQSMGMADDLLRNFGFSKDQLLVINNALAPTYEEEINTAGVEKEDYIMFAGRLEHQKGLDMLINAFSNCENQTTKLYLIGSGSQKEALTELVKEKSLETRVVFIEYTNQIKEYYKKAGATVLSSYYEGFPNVLVESIACGTPVVAFDLPSGPKEIIVEGVNGHLVEYLNVDELTRAIDCTLKTKWDSAAIKNTAKRYSREKIMKKYESVIETVVSEV